MTLRAPAASVHSAAGREQPNLRLGVRRSHQYPSQDPRARASLSLGHDGARASAGVWRRPGNLKPTKPAIQISDADRKRKILIIDKCTMAFKKWRENIRN